MSSSDPGGVGAPPTEPGRHPWPTTSEGPVDASGPTAELVSVGDHLGRILASVRPLPPVQVPVADALGLVLAQDVRALVSLPGFDNSAMDGYAVRAADVATATPDAPVALLVDADIPAGDEGAHTLVPRRAMRIMTGAPVPAGADAVVPVEDTDGGLERVRIGVSVAAGRHVRPLGDDLRAGDVVAHSGRRLGARTLAVIAAAGLGTVRVVPRPRVAVVSTGDELVPVGTTPGFGQVVDSNSTMLVATARELGVDAHLVSGVGDTEDAVLAALQEQALSVDAVVTTGGVSMGAYDAVKTALRRLGSVRFDKVAMQPGKPQGFGTLGEGVPVFTLPGNPVSALVSFEVFVAPALRVLAGRDPHEVSLVPARVTDGWRSPAGCVQFARVALGADPDAPGWVARSAGGQGSHMLGSLSEATALAVVPAGVTQVQAGDEVACLPLLGVDQVLPRPHGHLGLVDVLGSPGLQKDSS